MMNGEAVVKIQFLQKRRFNHQQIQWFSKFGVKQLKRLISQEQIQLIKHHVPIKQFINFIGI